MDEEATVEALTKNLRLCVRWNFFQKSFHLCVHNCLYIYICVGKEETVQRFSSIAHPAFEEVERGFRAHFAGKVEDYLPEDKLQYFSCCQVWHDRDWDGVVEPT